MSQLSQQQKDGLSDTKPFPVQDSPTIGRTHLYSPGSSQGSSSPLSDAGYRSQRKAAPSPLQTSTSATSPSLTPTKTTSARPPAGSVAGSGQTIRYTPQMSDQPRSPKDRLDELLASERSFYSPDEVASNNKQNGIDARLGKSSKPTASPLRSVSDPVSNTKHSIGADANPKVPVIPNTSSHRADMPRGPPRTSSIDSAISNISTGHSHKSSQDGPAQGATPADIANLIQTAGSAEAVIQYLLKEKQSQAAQNTQLWRLVDKQRAMILGLNKDLERALKDKERYRKKLKEGATNGPSSATQPPGSAKAEDSDSSKVNNVGALVSAGLREPQDSNDEPASPIEVALAPYPVTPPPDQTTVPAVKPLSNMVEAEHKMPSPSEHAFQQYNPDAPTKTKESKEPEKIPYNPSLPPSRALPPEPQRAAPKATITIPPPTVAITEPSPNIEQLRTFPAPPQPPRKPPPAPLNLGKSTDTSAHLHQTDSADDAESDYDDVLEVEDIPSYPDRGRRRTREQDDREREAAAIKDAEIRSLSKKSKSRPSAPNEKPSQPPTDPLPVPRQAVQISPPEGHLRQFSPPDSVAGSLAGVLSASGFSASESLNPQVVSPPPMSPGLPSSPRPITGAMGSPLPRNPREGNMASPPMSPRGMGAFPSPAPLSPRAPRQPIPLPPNTPMSLASPGIPKAGVLELTSPRPLQITKKSGNDSPKDTESGQQSAVSEASSIYRGFVTEEYPSLLLPPNALPSIEVRVASSRLRPSRASLLFPDKLDEDPVFTLAVFLRADGRELWRVEKDSASLYQLDAELKTSAAFRVQVPDKALFTGHAPAKIDARREALDTYMDEIMNTEMDTQSALEICKYLSTNTMAPNTEDTVGSSESTGDVPIKIGPGGRPTKNGYLTKRGKNFGGWKARFFVLDGPVFKYYEAPGGAHLGTIKLQNAQIGKQQHTDNQSPSRDVDDINNQYRHAFLILEPKRKDSSSLVRHVLCAESDKERDEWVEALLQYVDYRDSEDEGEGDQGHVRDESGSGHITGLNAKKKVYGQGRVLNVPEPDDSLRGFSYESASQGELPHGIRSKSTETPSPPAYTERDPSSGLPHSQSSKSISGPKNGAVIQDSSAWGNKPTSLAPAEDKTKVKKRSFFGFGSRPRGSSDSPEHANDSQTNLAQPPTDQHGGPIRAVFGAPLAEAVRYNAPVDVNVNLPAVVYRCVEYLEAKNAAAEEGIFRLSGSNVVIKSLRERFNVEGDVNLLTDEQYYDIHAVASLLKLYLRELPTTILTRELHLDFLAVTELHDTQQKIHALNQLVYRLPSPNKSLLRYLAGFLINIINHSDINKMTVRNVGIVFSPTLNIPAPVFALFLQQYDGIFGSEPEEEDMSPVEVTVTAPPLTPEDIRSPRKQQFQELPTPSYSQQSFQRQPPSSFPMLGQQPVNAYDTGFTPLQPTYETQYAGSQTLGGPEYGIQTQTLAGPAYEQFGNAGSMGYHQYLSSQTGLGNSKAKRRESAMFGMGGMGVDLGQKKPSFQNLRDESRLVNEESFFE